MKEFLLTDGEMPYQELNDILPIISAEKFHDLSVRVRKNKRDVAKDQHLKTARLIFEEIEKEYPGATAWPFWKSLKDRCMKED